MGIVLPFPSRRIPIAYSHVHGVFSLHIGFFFMDYIFYRLSFVFNQNQHIYYFDRNDFVENLLSKDVFDRICQYLTDATQIPLPTDAIGLDIDNIMRNLHQHYNLSISYGLCTGFESPDVSSQWEVSEYTEKADEKELRPNLEKDIPF